VRAIKKAGGALSASGLLVSENGYSKAFCL
jgi:hypothetical protein